MSQYIDTELIHRLQRETPILTAQIRSLYAELDKKFQKGIREIIGVRDATCNKCNSSCL